MRDKTNLSIAKSRKIDEFYTLLSDIEKEMQYYKTHFNNKIIYCPFDDYEKSNFVKYFKDNFKTLGLKKLISTHIHLDETRSEIYEYDGVEENISLLEGNGDFRSDECTKIKEHSDIIISNPPFSLFREIIDWLDDKDFLLIGNQNAICCKTIFHKIKKEIIRLGVTHRGGQIFFEQPTIFDDVEKIVIDGKNCIKMGAVHWFTTLDHGFIPQPIPLVKKYTPEEYPKYDNYDAINVDKTKDIPMDYEGVMGVPITFLDKYCPEQFEIIGKMSTTKVTDYEYGFPSINNKNIYARILIRNKKPRNNY